MRFAFLSVMILCAAMALLSGSAFAGETDGVEFNDWQSQFDIQKARIEEQSAGQWIHGKLPTESEREDITASEEPIYLYNPDGTLYNPDGGTRNISPEDVLIQWQ